MIKYITAYGCAACVFLVMDAVWLTTMSSRFYRPQLADMLTDGFRIGPAVLFYALFILGVVIFAIAPALTTGKLTTALIYGAMFGFFTYVTYDLTNQATLKHWPVIVTVVDIVWGTVLSATAATLGFLMTKAILKL